MFLLTQMILWFFDSAWQEQSCLEDHTCQPSGHGCTGVFAGEDKIEKAIVAQMMFH